MRHPRALLILALLTLGAPLALAQSGRTPQVTAVAEAEADRILAMPSLDPAGRLNQILTARELDNDAQFAVAARLPGVIEQVRVEPYALALEYMVAMPAPELHRVRRGETVIRTIKDMNKGSEEWRAFVALAEELDLPEKKLEAARVGPLENRVVRVEITAGKTQKTVELAWPSTPERDEKSRDTLSKVFGARPTHRSSGAGAPLPLIDGSFEDPASLGTGWLVENGPDLGGGTPVAEVILDGAVSIDGRASLRFFASQKTRQFLRVGQRVTVAPSMPLVARAMLKTDNVRKEFLQNPADIYLEMVFEDITGTPVAPPIRATGALETHTWQALEVKGIVPDEAAYVRIGLMCGLSGTAWFDGVTLTLSE